MLAFLEIATFLLIFSSLVYFLAKLIKTYNVNLVLVNLLVSIKFLSLITIFIYGKLGYAVDAKSIYDVSTIFFEQVYKDFGYRNLIGSDFVSLVISPITNYGKLRYFNTNFLFMLIGLYSTILYYLVLKKYSKSDYCNFLVVIIIFYPTLNLYTSYITKDLIIFSVISYLLFIINFENRNNYFNLKLISVLCIMLLVRPYTFIAFSFSIMVIYFLFYKFKTFKNIYSFVVSILLISLIFFFIFQKIYDQVFISEKNFLIEFYNYFNERSKLTNIGDAQINLYNYNLPLKIYNIIFGPSNINLSFSGLIYLIDKTFLIFLLMHILFVKIKLNKFSNKNIDLIEYSLLLFSIIMCLIISLSISNYGIALRLKLMFLPIFFYFIIKNLAPIKLSLK